MYKENEKQNYMRNEKKSSVIKQDELKHIYSKNVCTAHKWDAAGRSQAG